MKKIVKLSVAAAMLMGMSAVSAQADDGVNLLSNISVKGEVRPRYEMVDTNNDVNNANAVTNRFVLGVGADIAGTDWLSAYGEMTDVHAVNPNNYVSTDNGTASGNVNKVVDPEQTRLTQAYVDIKLGKTLIRAGRQMINLDNQRFIGAVGWRQMPQTYDGFLLANNSIEGLNLAASYVTGVNTIKAGDSDSFAAKVAVLHASYKVADALTVTAYDYMLSVEGAGFDTYGLALTGKPKLGNNLTLNYRAEYATQTDATLEYKNTVPSGSHDDEADASYYNLELGINMSGFLAGVNYEVMSGEGNSAAGGDTTFQTPLATGHAFNGWADIFLDNGGDGGLEDMNVMVGYKSKDFGLLKVIYHDFSAEASVTGENDDYGTEVDAVYKRAVPGVKGLTGMLKYADFSAEGGTSAYQTDVQKVWFMLDYKFASK